MGQDYDSTPALRRKSFFFLSVLYSIVINLTALLLIDLYTFPGNNKNIFKETDIKKTLILKLNDFSRIISEKAKSFLDKKRKRQGRYIALSDLGVRPSDMKIGPNVMFKGFNIKEKVGRFGDNTGFETFSVDGINSTYIYINRHIKRFMGYPPVFWQKGIEGTVQGRLVFDQNGVYLPHLSKIRSNNGFLKVHVANKLKELFHDPLPYDLYFVKHEYFLVDTTIRFAIQPMPSRVFQKMNNFSNGRHMAILIEKRGFNPNYGGNEWMDLIMTAMQYIPASGRRNSITTEGAIVPVLQGFLSEQGPLKLKDGTMQMNMDTKELLGFINSILSQKGIVNPKELREMPEENSQLTLEDYKDDPEWDEWAEQ